MNSSLKNLIYPSYNKNNDYIELDLYISKGYKKGSKNKGNKPPNTNKICVYYNNFKNRKYILKEELNMYLKKGFKLYSNRKDVN